MFIAKRHWSCLRSLVSAILLKTGLHWDFFWISRCCPVSWGYWNFGSTGPALSYAPADHGWDGYWDGQSTALVLGLGGCRVGQPASIATASSPYAKRSKGWDRFSQVLKASLPRPIPSGPALLCCPGKVQGSLSSAADRDGEGQLSCSHDLRLSFPNCHRWWERGMSPPPTSPYGWRAGPVLSCLYSWGKETPSTG